MCDIDQQTKKSNQEKENKIDTTCTASKTCEFLKWLQCQNKRNETKCQEDANEKIYCYAVRKRTTDNATVFSQKKGCLRKLLLQNLTITFAALLHEFIQLFLFTHLPNKM
ncbi:hypothetical protein RFI_03762 [Reticulomyxa filosa]|uniref:Uncharacterized protein n=1 Tax=Reticulomyxa filosa TaxID=46433 RepID=X6P584_RETFI|nr:hypothetical protein RFI_03762 [Reticulomyxa filosa]|eukprot:ETO33346.1 hypothetical protein RFI_03762 [Reticulomyxa filosa]